MKIPSTYTAQNILTQAETTNPGLWIAHCKVAADCAKAIADKCDNLDGETAYILGLMHDIGRRFGITDMRHIIDGYNFMKASGYDDCARICLTHSFPYKNIHSYNGKNDCTDDETKFILEFLEQTVYNDYDKLIQLCDSLAFPSGATYIEKRLVDVALRRGINDFTIPKWKAFLELKNYFDEKTGIEIYELLKVR